MKNNLSPCIFGFGYVEPVKKIKIYSILCMVAILNWRIFWGERKLNFAAWK